MKLSKSDGNQFCGDVQKQAPVLVVIHCTVGEDDRTPAREDNKKVKLVWTKQLTGFTIDNI